MVELAGERVRLRSLVLDDLEILMAGRADEPDMGGRSTEEVRSRLRTVIIGESTMEKEGFLELGVEADATLIGSIQARAPKNCFPPGVCEMGITLFPTNRGKGVGGEAVRLFTGYLHTEGWPRVQASTALANVAMRRVLENAGYTYEGVLRAFAPAGSGHRVDYAMYAAVRRPA